MLEQFLSKFFMPKILFKNKTFDNWYSDYQERIIPAAVKREFFDTNELNISG